MIVCLLFWLLRAEIAPAQDSAAVAAVPAGKPARIFLLKTGTLLVHTIQLFALQAPEKPVRIANGTFVELEVAVDSVGLLQGRSFADSPYSAKALGRKPVYLVVRPGMDYYFRITSFQMSQPIEVAELSANAFWLYVLVNELDNQGKRYRITADAVQPLPQLSTRN